MKDPVYITGLGAVSAHGHRANDLCVVAEAGQAAPSPAVLDDFLPQFEAFVPPSYRRSMSRAARMASRAVSEAWGDARLGEDVPAPADLAVFAAGPEDLAGAIAVMLRARGTVAAFRCSGQALRAAWAEIVAGRCTAAVVVGADCDLAAVAAGDVSDVARPFDKFRNGAVVGEGAAALILESEARLSSSLVMRVLPYARLAGAGSACDAYHPNMPDPGGYGVSAAMERAMETAGFKRSDIDLVFAHADGTTRNDYIQARGIANALGGRVGEVPVASVLPITGHTGAAQGAFTALLAAWAVFRKVYPPTAGFGVPDDDCLPLSITGYAAGRFPGRAVLANVVAPGGVSVTLALTRVCASAHDTTAERSEAK